jgi:uncharacterized Fe-S cluster-containing MiaB family protein
MTKERIFKIELFTHSNNKNDTYSAEVKADNIFTAFTKVNEKAREEHKDIQIFTGGSFQIID